MDFDNDLLEDEFTDCLIEKHSKFNVGDRCIFDDSGVTAIVTKRIYNPHAKTDDEIVVYDVMTFYDTFHNVTQNELHTI